MFKLCLMFSTKYNKIQNPITNLRKLLKKSTLHYSQLLTVIYVTIFLLNYLFIYNFQLKFFNII